MIVGWDSKTDRYFISNLTDREARFLFCSYGLIKWMFANGEISRGIDLPGGESTSGMEQINNELFDGIKKAKLIRTRIKNG